MHAHDEANVNYDFMSPDLLAIWGLGLIFFYWKMRAFDREINASNSASP